MNRFIVLISFIYVLNQSEKGVSSSFLYLHNIEWNIPQIKKNCRSGGNRLSYFVYMENERTTIFFLQI